MKESYVDVELDSLPSNPYWSDISNSELKMHSIHAYPAKFPSLVVERSIEYARSKNHEIDTIVDPFCGCGTTALESFINGYNFWGCDINPVATMIAEVKSNSYNQQRLLDINNNILKKFYNSKTNPPKYIEDHERINYWFYKKQISDLYKLLSSINTCTNNNKYRTFYLIAFSNILKGCSKWLTKSIKPQIDPEKTPKDVITSFSKQVSLMLKANMELITNYTNLKRGSVNISNTNFLKLKFKKPIADLVVTSPPYATSYEYADLHQLSALWLGFVSDYRELRVGSIGSVYNTNVDMDNLNLNNVGNTIINNLLKKDVHRAKAVSKYLMDLKLALNQIDNILRKKGMAVFVIGDTKYKGVDIQNTKFLIEELQNMNYNVIVNKREISSKILTPYRNKEGRFSSSKGHMDIYSHEFVVIGEKH